MQLEVMKEPGPTAEIIWVNLYISNRFYINWLLSIQSLKEEERCQNVPLSQNLRIKEIRAAAPKSSSWRLQMSFFCQTNSPRPKRYSVLYHISLKPANIHNGSPEFLPFMHEKWFIWLSDYCCRLIFCQLTIHHSSKINISGRLTTVLDPCSTKWKTWMNVCICNWCTI